MTTKNRMELRILGPLEVWVDGRMLELGGGRQRALLALLALQLNEVVSSDRLVDVLWAGRPPATANKALQNLVVQLRDTLDPTREGVLVTQAPGYAFTSGARCRRCSTVRAARRRRAAHARRGFSGCSRAAPSCT